MSDYENLEEHLHPSMQLNHFEFAYQKTLDGTKAWLTGLQFFLADSAGEDLTLNLPRHGRQVDLS